MYYVLNVSFPILIALTFSVALFICLPFSKKVSTAGVGGIVFRHPTPTQRFKLKQI
jgi:hypothetical protein